MKTLVIGCIVLSALFSPAAYSRGGGGGIGGMGGHSSLSTGGAFGTSPATPGTNSAGTALASSGTGTMQRGATLGTGDPAVDREDRKAAQMVESVCRGC